ncbi:MAG: hypothetical protein AABX11_06530 [Nanoarchaeota archaeon]
MSMNREKLKEYANEMVRIIEGNIPTGADLLSFANRNLKVEGLDGFVSVSTRVIRMEDNCIGVVFNYYPGSESKGASPLSFDVPFFGKSSRIILECDEMIGGYNLYVKDCEGNFVQNKDFEYRGMDSALSQVLSGL